MNGDELRALINNYRPSRMAIDAMRNVRVLATVGPSASGKTTITEELLKKNPAFYFISGETSRPPRPGERDGVEYVFRNKNEMIAEIKKGIFTQVVIGPSGDLYGTSIRNFKDKGVGTAPLIPRGVEQFRTLPLQFFVAAFIVPADFELWQSWLDHQAEISNWTSEQRAGRIAEARTSYEFALHDKDVRFVLNDSVERAAVRLGQVGNGNIPTEEEQARETAKINYTKLHSL